MRIGVTGADGFVGRALLARLAARGHEAVALTRGGAPISAAAETRAIGDLAAPDAIVPARLAGLDAVIHLAGRAHRPDETGREHDALYRAVNTLGTVRMAEAALAAGARRFVFVSTVKVLGEASPEGPDGAPIAFTAQAPLRPADPYSRSKAEAEEALAPLAARGLETVLVRPPLVHGPGAGGNLAALMRLVARGVPLPLGALANRRSLVGVANLADLLVLAARHPAAPGHTLLASDLEDVSTPGLVRALAAAMDRPARLLPVPPSLLRALMAFAGRRAAYDRLAGSLFVDPRPGYAALGFRPARTLAQGLAAMAEAPPGKLDKAGERD